MRTIGAFYREEVLTLPKKKLRKVELPSYSGDSKIEKELFTWKLGSGKNFVECDTEEEARYLKVFLDTGLSEVMIPRENDYLKEILPQLEKIKSKIDEIIDSYISGLISRKMRETVKSAVYAEISK